jgi:hypothetical protein
MLMWQVKTHNCCRNIQIIEVVTFYLFGALTFGVWLFKLHVSAAVGALFNLNTHCGTVLSLSDEKDVHLMEQFCPISLLKVKYMCYT